MTVSVTLASLGQHHQSRRRRPSSGPRNTERINRKRRAPTLRLRATLNTVQITSRQLTIHPTQVIQESLDVPTEVVDRRLGHETVHGPDSAGGIGTFVQVKVVALVRETPDGATGVSFGEQAAVGSQPDHDFEVVTA